MATFGIKENKCKEPVYAKSEIVDAVYPVGSVYMSVDDVDPASLFGGTWTPIKGYFLRASSSAFNAKETGGAANASYTPRGTVGRHTLTVNEIPSHTHKLEGSNTHGVVRDSNPQILNAKAGTDYSTQTYENSFDLAEVTSAATGGGQGHDHDFAGLQASIPTVPPYYVVNMWRRTA